MNPLLGLGIYGFDISAIIFLTLVNRVLSIIGPFGTNLKNKNKSSANIIGVTISFCHPIALCALDHFFSTLKG